jgi:hypothetical protein
MKIWIIISYTETRVTYAVSQQKSKNFTVDQLHYGLTNPSEAYSYSVTWVDSRDRAHLGSNGASSYKMQVITL